MELEDELPEVEELAEDAGDERLLGLLPMFVALQPRRVRQRHRSTNNLIVLTPLPRSCVNLLHAKRANEWRKKVAHTIAWELKARKLPKVHEPNGYL